MTLAFAQFLGSKKHKFINATLVYEYKETRFKRARKIVFHEQPSCSVYAVNALTGAAGGVA